eukprot:TRINITY_DN15988_c0_g1_i1.p1 TRINITY_DN15988_c0_g1~~TRINITY_DN15988_c0_g1_i1.p1  ORF type:complete len:208 (-),score=48.04 TRINITY_DN15988_c0_g1_i1:67-690(-)
MSSLNDTLRSASRKRGKDKESNGSTDTFRSMKEEGKDKKGKEERKKEEKGGKGKEKGGKGKGKEEELDLDLLSIISVSYEESSEDGSYDGEGLIEKSLSVDMIRESSRQKLPFMDYLCDALVLDIYVRTKAEDMMRLGLTCKRLYRLTGDIYAWEGRVNCPPHTKAMGDVRSYYSTHYANQRVLTPQDTGKADSRVGSPKFLDRFFK